MTIKTILHTYRFDISKPAEAAAYENMCETLRSAIPPHPHWMHCLAEPRDKNEHRATLKANDGQFIELETDCLFDNQWNTGPLPGSPKGLRVFDWYEGIYPKNRNIKEGHWLEQTKEMREIRRNTNKCGYCGNRAPAAAGDVFCSRCLGSAYLKSNELHLLRMMPIDAGFAVARAKLSEAEAAYLLPLYREAQIHGHATSDKERIAKIRHDIEAKRKKSIDDANTEANGLIWLMDHGINTSNVIFYTHTQCFTFGWRKPVDAEVLSGILDVISEFNYPYEIKCEDGRTLTGNIE